MESIKEIFRQIFGRGRKELELTYSYGILTLWAIYYIVLLGGAILAHFGLHGGLTILFYIFLPVFVAAVFRPTILVGVFGLGLAIGIPAEGPAGKMSEKFGTGYLNAVSIVAISAAMYLATLNMFPWVAASWDSIFIETIGLTVTAMTLAWGVASGAIKPDKWYRYVIGVSLLYVAIGIIMAVPKQLWVKAGVISTAAQQVAAQVADDDPAVRDERQLEKLEQVRLVRECQLDNATLHKLSPQSLTIYQSACNAAGHKLTIEELKNGFPGVYKIWQETENKTYLKEAPQAPRKLTALEQDVFTLGSLNQGALDTETKTCIQFMREIVEGYTEEDGSKVVGRSLNDSDYATNEFCSEESLKLIKKLQRNVQVQATTGSSGFAARQEEVINKMAETLPDWMPDWLKVATAWTLGLLAAHGLYFAIIAAVGALLIAFGLRKKNTAVATTTTTIAAKASDGNGWKTLAVLLFVSGISFYGWNHWGWDKIVAGAIVGASRGASEAETPVWNKFLTKDFVKGHGTKAFVGGVEYDVVLDGKDRISLQQNGDEMYAMGQEAPCSEPKPTSLSDGTSLIAATCSGRWRVGGSAYGNSYGTWVGKLNATYNGMIRVAYFSYSADPNRATLEVWFR